MPAIIIQASIDHRSNIDSQHFELELVIGLIIFFYMGYNDFLSEIKILAKFLTNIFAVLEESAEKVDEWWIY